MIIGHQNILTCLEKAAENGRLAHAYIFSGPRNIGKTAVAEHLAAKFLITETDRLLLHPNFKKIGEGAISKEEVDNVLDWIRLSAFGGGYKIFLMQNAHQMSLSAANAFLKTLEEPPRNSIIIMLTSQLGKILPTIRSRAAVINFKSVDKDEILRFLKNRGIQEPKRFADLCCGRPGRALDLAQNPEKLQTLSSDLKEFSQLFFGGSAEKFGAANRLAAEKDKEIFFRKIDFWLEILRDMLFYKYSLNDNMVYIKNFEPLKIATRQKPVGYLAALSEKLIKMKELLNYNINFKLMLENLII